MDWQEKKGKKWAVALKERRLCIVETQTVTVSLWAHRAFEGRERVQAGKTTFRRVGKNPADKRVRDEGVGGRNVSSGLENFG